MDSDEDNRVDSFLKTWQGQEGGAIAAGFLQGKLIEAKVRAVLVALTRMDFLSTPDDGKTFLLPRAA